MSDAMPTCSAVASCSSRGGNTALLRWVMEYSLKGVRINSYSKGHGSYTDGMSACDAAKAGFRDS